MRLVDAVRDLADEVAVIGWGRSLIPNLGNAVQALSPGALAVDPDRRRVADAVDPVDDLFDVGRDHVGAAQDDQILEPARHVEVAFAIDKAEVAGSEPAAGHEYLGGLAGIVVVAAHHPWALDADLALLADRALCRRPLVARGQNAHRHPPARLADR